jgi:predicted flap endonuclease-1-like 5' DNA nuclease
MLIEFTGHSFVDRSAGPKDEYIWPAKAPKPRVVEVSDAQTIVDLLTTRGGERNQGGEFKIAKDEPLLSLEGMGPKMAANLALAGVVSQDQLAGMLVADQKTLAGTLGVDEQVVRGWAAASKEAVKARAATAGAVAPGSNVGTLGGSNIASGPVSPASTATAAPAGTEGPTTSGGIAGVESAPRQ